MQHHVVQNNKLFNSSAMSLMLLQEGATLHNEVFGVCPDQAVTDAKWHKAGDLRATVAPFLANMTIGPDNFKWMLFGDDDTVFLIDNVLNLLPHLDPTVPYFMTDHLWYPEVVGKQATTLCSSSPSDAFHKHLHHSSVPSCAASWPTVVVAV